MPVLGTSTPKSQWASEIVPVPKQTLPFGRVASKGYGELPHPSLPPSIRTIMAGFLQPSFSLWCISRSGLFEVQKRQLIKFHIALSTSNSLLSYSFFHWHCPPASAAQIYHWTFDCLRQDRKSLSELTKTPSPLNLAWQALPEVGQ